jgi:hypothetical protein
MCAECGIQRAECQVSSARDRTVSCWSVADRAVCKKYFMCVLLAAPLQRAATHRHQLIQMRTSVTVVRRFNAAL